MSSSPPADRAAVLHESYEAAALGRKGPLAIVVNGALLNTHTQTSNYDPKKAYLVTPNGISEFVE